MLSKVLSFLYGVLRRTAYRRIADVLAQMTPYCHGVHYVSSSEEDVLFGLLACSEKVRLADLDAYAPRSGCAGRRNAIVLNGTFNSCLDIQAALATLKGKLSRHDRVIAVLYNPYLRWLYGLADWLRLRSAADATTFVTRVDLRGLARISGYDVVRLQPAACFPWSLLGLGTLLDMVIRVLPGVSRLSLAEIAVLRPVVKEERPPSLTLVIPARNEKGNIRVALERLPDIPGADVEVIYVEGHSEDGTWEEINRVVETYSGKATVRAFQQTGRGKADAVRLGFSKASGDLLAILDADLTMPPELLGRFYSAYCDGHGDFVNGSRLVYPMEGRAMRFLNRLANIFFAKALSYVLGVRLGDSLCGTKLLAREDYRRMVAWREGFGDFDPFGDFELLFPAATLALGIVDVPVRYRDRTYGDTNISRFRHGLMLARMTLLGLVRIKMGLGVRKRAGAVSSLRAE